MTFKNAIGYIRVLPESRDEDAEYNIDLQKKEILLYANDNGYHIIDWKIDEISNMKDDSFALSCILYGADTVNSSCDAVIAFKNDCLTFDTKLYFYYLYVLAKKNIKLLCVQESFAENTEVTNSYRAMAQFIAEQERKNIARYTLKVSLPGRPERVCEGSCIPLGYKMVDGALVINEEEASLVRAAFDKLSKGGIDEKGDKSE